MIALSIFFFLVDLTAFIIFQKWVICSLLAYIIFQILSKDINPLLFFPILLFLIEDSFLTGRVGSSLIFLIPMVFLATRIKHLFDPKLKFFYCFFMVLAISCQEFLLKSLLLGQNIGFYSTTYKIFINIIVTYLVLLGMRGNRSFLGFPAKRGKSGLQTGGMPNKKSL
jgi:hypothetical protein